MLLHATYIRQLNAAARTVHPLTSCCCTHRISINLLSKHAPYIRQLDAAARNVHPPAWCCRTQRTSINLVPRHVPHIRKLGAAARRVHPLICRCYMLRASANLSCARTVHPSIECRFTHITSPNSVPQHAPYIRQLRVAARTYVRPVGTAALPCIYQLGVPACTAHPYTLCRCTHCASANL